MLTQAAAEALGLPVTQVRMDLGRASHGPAPCAGGSMGASSWGWAVTKACTTPRQRIDEAGGTDGRTASDPGGEELPVR